LCYPCSGSDGGDRGAAIFVVVVMVVIVVLLSLLLWLRLRLQLVLTVVVYDCVWLCEVVVNGV
jgi:hypothetical protein